MALAMAKSAASLNTDGSDPNRQQSDNAADNNSIFPYSFCPHPHLRYRFPSQLRRGLIQELAAKYGSNSSGDSKTTSLESVGIAGFFGGLLV